MKQACAAVSIGVALGEHRKVCAHAYGRWGYEGSIAPADCVLEARRGDELVGVARIAPEHGVLVLRGMQVAPHARGRGIGRQLLCAALVEVGARECFCMPYTHLTGFYGEAGFIPLAETDAPEFLRRRLQASHRAALCVCLMRRPGQRGTRG